MAPALTGLPPAGTKSTGRPTQNGEEAKNYESFLGLFCASANSILQGSSFLFYRVFTRDAGDRVARGTASPAATTASVPILRRTVVPASRRARVTNQLFSHLDRAPILRPSKFRVPSHSPALLREPAPQHEPQYGATRASEVLAWLRASLPPRGPANRTMESCSARADSCFFCCRPFSVPCSALLPRRPTRKPRAVSFSRMV